MNEFKFNSSLLTLLILFFLDGYGMVGAAQDTNSGTIETNLIELTDEQIANIVERSYQYVAMYNVNNKFAIGDGWHNIVPDTRLKDHTMQDIARPNNDTLYIGSMLDLRKDPVILDLPAFDSKYVSLMVTGYDHYVNVPPVSHHGRL